MLCDEQMNPTGPASSCTCFPSTHSSLPGPWNLHMQEGPGCSDWGLVRLMLSCRRKPAQDFPHRFLFPPTHSYPSSGFPSHLAQNSSHHIWAFPFSCSLKIVLSIRSVTQMQRQIRENPCPPRAHRLVRHSLDIYNNTIWSGG